MHRFPPYLLARSLRILVWHRLFQCPEAKTDHVRWVSMLVTEPSRNSRWFAVVCIPSVNALMARGMMRAHSHSAQNSVHGYAHEPMKKMNARTRTMHSHACIQNLPKLSRLVNVVTNVLKGLTVVTTFHRQSSLCDEARDPDQFPAPINRLMQMGGMLIDFAPPHCRILDSPRCSEQANSQFRCTKCTRLND